MLLRKHQFIALVSGSLSVLGLANCTDSDVAPNADGGSTSAGKAGASDAVAGASAGSSGKAGESGGEAGDGDHAGEPSEAAGDTSEAGSAGNPSAGNPSAGSPSAGSPAGGALNVSGSGNVAEAGEGGLDDHGGAAGAGGVTGPHVNAILKYNFDEGSGLIAVDSSSSGLNGTLSVATAWATQGRNGGGLALTGGVLPTTYVTVPSGLFKGVTATTIATWVKLNVDLGWNRIFDFGGTGTDVLTRFMYLTTNTPSGVYFSTFGGNSTREAVVSTGTLLPLNVWKHVAVTVADGGARAIYLDGYPAAKATTVDVPPSELDPLSASSWLGKSRFDADAGLNATLDEFQVYDRVLTPAEIATLAAPKGDYARIPFDEGTGTTSTDTSTRGVNATLNGATWTSGQAGGAAVQVSGTDQYVTLTNPLAGCTDSLTVAMWVKQVTATAWARLLDFGGTNDNFMFLTPNNGATAMQLSIHTALAETTVLSPTTLPADSTWHHVAIVISPVAANIYVDGALGGSTLLPITPSVLGATNEHWLGKSRFTVDPYFNGAFDEVRISCRAFTADEIKSLAFH